MRSMILAALAWCAVSTAASAEDIHLACDGVGTVTRSDHTSVQEFDWRSGHTVTVAGPTVYNVQMPDKVLVDIVGGGGRIKAPILLTSVVGAGGDDGWRPFTALSVKDAEIRGQFRLSPPNSPTVTINRTTGHIELVGPGAGFSGDCRPNEAAAAGSGFRG